jgi:hypothetical protein
MDAVDIMIRVNRRICFDMLVLSPVKAKAKAEAEAEVGMRLKVEGDLFKHGIDVEAKVSF